MANLTLVQAINLALTQEMEADDRVIILGEDVGLNGGVFRVTEGLQQRFGEHRVVDTPLAESGIIGTAIGLAVARLVAGEVLETEEGAVELRGPSGVRGVDHQLPEAGRCHDYRLGRSTEPSR